MHINYDSKAVPLGFGGLNLKIHTRQNRVLDGSVGKNQKCTHEEAVEGFSGN